ncbi:phage holin [Virgibacillus salexigens]|uniref:phage holin n=1 Tax=Virgibacillus salexigens TaxID=61016 RepID=UPI00190A901C|nr:phage holin [Virgibacillus salexigens]
MKAAITRLVVLGILLLNQGLVVYGWDPLPFTEDQVYAGVSTVATVGVSLWTYWKNNNVTKKAQEQEAWLKEQGLK